jgi:hypothetical protein
MSLVTHFVTRFVTAHHDDHACDDVPPPINHGGAHDAGKALN